MKKYLLLFLFLFSSASFAEIVRYSSYGTNYTIVEACTGLTLGDVFDSGAGEALCPVGKTWVNSRYSMTSTGSSYNGINFYVGATRSDGKQFTGVINVTVATCDSPHQINPFTGTCEEPPVDLGGPGMV